MTHHNTPDTLDRILGTIYGTALGDAVGLCTEFLKSSHVKKFFGTENYIPFPSEQKSFHSVRWEDGDWTDDTDQMILILQSYLESEDFEKPDYRIFAQKLKQWIRKGFPELGDQGGMGLGRTVGTVVEQTAEYDQDPHLASKKVWKDSKENAAANGALMRTAIVGVVGFDNMDQVLTNTENFARVTHADSRCIASCFVITSLIASILQEKRTATDKTLNVDALLKDSLQIGLKALEKKHKKEFLSYFNMSKLEDMKLDEPGKIGYTLKCMSAGLYGLRNQTDSVKRIMTDVALEAGDADTNLAVCGALIGVSRGFEALPKDWMRKFPHKSWLDRQVVELAVKMGFEKQDVEKRLDLKSE